MQWRDRWTLAAIVALATALRLPGIESAIPGPSPDEASNIVDARCLFESGADQHGTPLPLYLQAFGDYREGLFVYVASGIVANAASPLAAIRIVAATIGIATVTLIYMAGMNWTGAGVGLWAAFFLATNPQHILWSRLGMEVILVPFALIGCLLAYVAFADGKRGGASLVAVSLVFLVYSGMMGKPLAAILFCLIALSWLLGGATTPRIPWISLAVLLIGLIPAGLAILDGRATSRLGWINEGISTGWPFWKGVGERYLAYWSPRYLLVPGGEGMPALPGTPNLGWAATFCLAAGIGLIAWKRPRHGWFLLALAALVPVSAALTATIAPSRVLAAAPVQCLIMGYGIFELTRRLARWGNVAVLLVVAGQVVTIGLVARDLTGPAAEYLDRFFRGPQARLIKAAWAQRTGFDLIVIDTALLHAPIQAIFIARPPIEDFQGKLLDLYLLRRASLRAGSLLFDFLPGGKVSGRAERMLVIAQVGAGPPGWEMVEQVDDVGLFVSPNAKDAWRKGDVGLTAGR